MSSLDSEIAAKRADISVAENDILHNNGNIARLQGEIEQADKNADELDKTIAEKQEKITALDFEITSKQREYAKISEQLNTINLDSSRSGDKLQELTAELSVLTTQSADARVIDMTTDSSINELTARIENLKETNEEKTVQLKELGEMKESYSEQKKTVQEEISSAENSIAGLEMKLNSKNKKRNELKAESETG